ncbi:Bardet-Biedl syndrome 1 protein homolog [Bactrocera dorsalis]|uniref:Bardet-Biedl syndrome 1 protein homolog n=1 Tax=Bactrocera dorsalis TaxID=27457 RepID=A0A6I9VDV0_BACDO|nr:Bardet-Biedl syndrome 1 protein homolog [Bactrocera dorsalis]
MSVNAKWLQVIVDEDEPRPRLNTVTSCMTLCDIKCDNYVRLIAADIALEDEPTATLKIFRGTTLHTELKLNGIPAAVQSFYSDESEPKTPIIAVAIAESVLFFRNLKPYFKYTVPGLGAEELERDLWLKLPTVRVEQQPALVESLRSIERPKMSRKSQKLIQLSQEEQNEFILKYADATVMRHPNIVALGCLERISSDVNPPSHLVIATDNGDILVLEPQSFGLIYQAKTCDYETVPSMIAVHGTYETDFRIVIATRYGGVYLLRKSVKEGQEIFKISHPFTGLMLLPVDQTITVCAMDCRLVCYSKKGKQLYVNKLPALPMCMIPITLPHLGLTLCCVALEGGLVQLYLQRYLVNEFHMVSTIGAMCFGRTGHEDYVLNMVSVEGEIFVKILKRTAAFDPSELLALKGNVESKAMVETILEKSKKSSIFVEQAAREKQNAKTTYGAFQAELWRLRYVAARATVDAINSSESTISGDITHAPVKLSAEVCGIGPEFRLYLTIQNMSSYKMASNLTVLLHADRRHYTLNKSMAKLPSILPGVPLKIDFEIVAVLDPNLKLPPHTLTIENSQIRVMLLKARQTKPLIAAVIAMPQSEANV